MGDGSNDRMSRAHQKEKREAALRDLDAGVTVPVVCQRHGMSERTLYRWRRRSVRARAETGLPLRIVSDGAGDVFRRALPIVAGLLAPEARERAAAVLRSALSVSRAEARRMLGLDRESGRPSPRVGFAMARRRLEAPLSLEFGKAPWLGVWSSPDSGEFLRNVGLSGVAAAAAFRDAGCSDVIALHLGRRAEDALREHGIRLWRGIPGRPARELVEALRRGELAPWPSDLVTLAPPPRRPAGGR